MGVPTGASTSTDIVTEAFYKCGIATPTSDQIARAINYFFEEIKGDIVLRAGNTGNTRLKSLQSERIFTSLEGKSIYNASSNLDEEISISILDGSHYGLVAAASTGNLVNLCSTETISMEDAEGSAGVLIVPSTTKTNVPEFAEILYYGATTDSMLVKIATTWAVTPTSDDTYVIIDQITQLDEENELDDGPRQTVFRKGKPTTYKKIEVDGVTKYQFNCPFDHARYGVLERFYADIGNIDTTSALITKLTRKWRVPLVLGVAMKIAQDEDDNKYATFKTEYEQAVDNIIKKEYPFGGEFEGFEL